MNADLHAQNQDENASFSLDAVIRNVFECGAERPHLTPEEESDLIARAQAFDEAASIELIYAYAPILRAAVGKTRLPDGTQRRAAEDLHAAAVSAIWEAIAAHGAGEESFGTLVGRFVRDSVHDAESIDSPISVPGRTLRRFYSILEKDEDGDVYAAAKLAPEFGMSEQVFLSVAAARYMLDLPEGAPASGNDFLAVEDHETATRARAAVQGLERTVIDYRYGFITGEAMSHEAVAEELKTRDLGESINKPKVVRLDKSALRRMRRALGL